MTPAPASVPAPAAVPGGRSWDLSDLAHAVTQLLGPGWRYQHQLPSGIRTLHHEDGAYWTTLTEAPEDCVQVAAVGSLDGVRFVTVTVDSPEDSDDEPYQSCGLFATPAGAPLADAARDLRHLLVTLHTRAVRDHCTSTVFGMLDLASLTAWLIGPRCVTHEITSEEWRATVDTTHISFRNHSAGLHSLSVMRCDGCGHCEDCHPCTDLDQADAGGDALSLDLSDPERTVGEYAVRLKADTERLIARLARRARA